MNNEILYLVHITGKNPSKFKELRISTDIENQFPGVYFSLITKHNRLTEHLYSGKYIMIFSAELLKQQNYHINVQDHNGFISEKNTYFPWNLDKAVKKINANAKHQNEVVFHDNVPMKYICRIITKPSAANNLDAYLSFKLPEERCINTEKPDMSKIPFYAYSFESMYTGNDPPPPSSLSFFRKIARLAKISADTKEEIVNTLRKKMHYLLKHRNEQDISVLRDKVTFRKTRKVVKNTV